MYANDTKTHGIGRKAQEIRNRVNECEEATVIGVTIAVNVGMGCQGEAISALQSDGWEITQVDCVMNNGVTVHIRPE